VRPLIVPCGPGARAAARRAGPIETTRWSRSARVDLCRSRDLAAVTTRHDPSLYEDYYLAELTGDLTS
jgi:hypothetical protein